MKESTPLKQKEYRIVLLFQYRFYLSLIHIFSRFFKFLSNSTSSLISTFLIMSVLRFVRFAMGAIDSIPLFECMFRYSNSFSSARTEISATLFSLKFSSFNEVKFFKGDISVIRFSLRSSISKLLRLLTVSYTHLDVYKRQVSFYLHTVIMKRRVLIPGQYKKF